VRALLLDVEGTTTPIDFVSGTLFPFARQRLRGFLQKHGAAAASDVARLREEHAAEVACGEAPPRWADTLDAIAVYVEWLMDRDRKSAGLKSLQGKIWEAGYREGVLRGEVYPDVPRAFARWRARGLRIAIFSSGSVLAQQLLFRHSSAGDLTPAIAAYFDTAAGPKREAESYRRIAAALAEPPGRVVFLSDVVAELDAALSAGMLTGLSVRPGHAAAASAHPVVGSLDEALP
jgi:enolase-phosphatase E1